MAEPCEPAVTTVMNPAGKFQVFPFGSVNRHCVPRAAIHPWSLRPTWQSQPLSLRPSSRNPSSVRRATRHQDAGSGAGM